MTFDLDFYFLFFRLNIPPFVPARTVLEGLESEDDQEKPVKHETSHAKVESPPTAGGSSDSLLLFRFQTALLFVSRSADFRQSEGQESERRSS